MIGVLYGGVQEKCPGRHIIITTDKSVTLFSKGVKL